MSISAKLTLPMIAALAAAVKTWPADQKTAVAGTVIGRAYDIQVRKTADDTGEVHSLKGFFEGHPVTGEAIASGLLYLPRADHDAIEAMLYDPASGDRTTAQTVGLAFRVHIDRAGSGAVYRLEPLMTARDDDPLADLRELVAHQTVANDQQQAGAKAGARKK